MSVKIGSRVLVLPATDSGGYFTILVPLTSDEVSQLVKEPSISFQSLATAKTPVASRGAALLVPDVGVTVITDVDDTIKVTEVANKPERDANTFVRPFTAVPFMPELYTTWQQAYGPAIHFHAAVRRSVAATRTDSELYRERRFSSIHLADAVHADHGLRQLAGGA